MFGALDGLVSTISDLVQDSEPGLGRELDAFPFGCLSFATAISYAFRELDHSNQALQ